MTTFRDLAAPIVARVIAEVGTEDKGALRRALNAAYPFQDRRYWAYKAWLDEIHLQLQQHGAAKSDGQEGPLLDIMRAGGLP